jgi:hypothetical protein
MKNERPLAFTLRAPVTSAESTQDRAAYGLRLLGVGAHEALVRAPAGWEAWTVRKTVESGAELDEEDMSVWDDRALIPMPGLGRIVVDRGRREIAFCTVRPISDEAVLHPGLVPAAAVVSWWKRRASVHASAVIGDGGAWALVAGRGGGKSTTAALLAERGNQLFADDMLIAEGTQCFAGPLSVDLREDVAARLGGAFLGRVGRRDRWRKAFAGTAAEAPLAGIVELTWGEGKPKLEPLDLGWRVELVGRHASMPLEGDQLLALASRPAFRLTRPRRFDAAAAAVDLVRDAIGAP